MHSTKVRYVEITSFGLSAVSLGSSISYWTVRRIFMNLL